MDLSCVAHSPYILIWFQVKYLRLDVDLDPTLLLP